MRARRWSGRDGFSRCRDGTAAWVFARGSFVGIGMDTMKLPRHVFVSQEHRKVPTEVRPDRGRPFDRTGNSRLRRGPVGRQANIHLERYRGGVSASPGDALRCDPEAEGNDHVSRGG